jgi:hypothetical protein
MIVLRYDSLRGNPYADGMADRIVAHRIRRQKHAPGLEHLIHTSTDNVLNALRVALKQGRIALQDIRIEYVDRERAFNEPAPHNAPPYRIRTLRLYPSGGISPRPRGFADFTEHWLMELL